MSLTGIAIRRPVMTWVCFFALGALGLFTLTRLSISLTPKVNIPIVTIKTLYPGSGPDQVETLVTKPVEDAISTTNNLKEISSVSMEGVSFVMAEFYMETSSEVAATDVREKLAAIRSRLPDDVEEPEVLKLDINAQPILYIGVFGPDLREVYQLADQTIKPALQTVPGVGNIDLLGGLKREIRVEVFPQQLVHYKMDLTGLVNRLAAENINLPSGRFNLSDLEFSGRLNSEFFSPEEISQLIVPDMERATGRARQIHLESLALVKDTFAEVRDKARINCQDAVALIIQKQPAANTVKVAQLVREEIKRLEGRIPSGYKIQVIVDTSPFIREAVDDVKSNLILGVILTGLVLLLFLHSLNSTLIVSLTIPLSLMGTLFFMYLAGFTLNVLSLSSLALCTGIIIDCSIVVLENIYRHLHDLKKPLLVAVEEGTAEVTPAVMASMLTNIVVFLPIVFTTGIVGQFFKEFGLVQVFATAVAMAIAFTLLPMLASRLLTERQQSPWAEKWESAFSRFREGYKKILEKALRRPGIVLLLALFLLTGSFLLIPLIGTEFMTEPDQGISSIAVRMPPGTNLRRTEETVNLLENRIKKIPESDQIFATIGRISGGATTAGSVGSEYASIIVKWKDSRRRSASQILAEIKPFLAEIPGATFSVAEVSSVVGRGSAAPFMMYVTGQNWETLLPSGEKLLTALRETPGVSDADISYHPGKPELNFVVHRERLAEFDLSPRTVALNCRAALEGLVATKFRQKDQEYDLRVTIPEQYRSRLDILANLPIKNSLGDLYLLGQVASFQETKGPTVRERYNRRPSVTLTAHVSKPLGDVVSSFRKKAASLDLPAEISLESGANIRLMSEAFRDMAIAIVMAAILVYLVMAAQFESWKEPFVIMGALPLAGIGILTALFLMGKTINIFSLLGTVILIGIGVNNSILIVDFSKNLIQKGSNPVSAIVQAASTRLRPCLMTSLAAGAGALPLALATGKAATLRSPIGATVLGGVVSSTVLTLFVIPVLYLLLVRHQKN